MKAKIIVLIFVGLIAGTLGAIKSRETTNKAQSDRQKFSTGSLLWYVQQAKDKGEKQITIPASTVDYAGSSNSTTLEKALSAYDCVIATVIDKQTIPRKDEIVTWYNFKIAETVSKSSKAVASNDEGGLPEQLRQADDDVQKFNQAVQSLKGECSSLKLEIQRLNAEGLRFNCDRNGEGSSCIGNSNQPERAMALS